MQKNQNFLPFFIVFFALSILLIFVGKSGIINTTFSYIGIVSTPLRSTVFSALTQSSLQNQKIEDIIAENLKLRRQIVEKQNLTRENEDLKNQFEKSKVNTSLLLPAKIIGAPGFVSGESTPDYLIIDKGESDDIKKGSVVILENNIIGKVSEVFGNISKVVLSIKDETNFPAVVIGNDANLVQGIIRGTGDGFLLENVVLAEKIDKESLVVTKGNFDVKGEGYPPDLIVGKITSVERESSDLFQIAKVKSFVDFSNLINVFIIK